MTFNIWQIWLLLAFICLILEIFIPSFVIFNFGVGAFLATLVAGIGLSLEWQIVFFSVGTLTSFFLVRPVMKKWFYKKSNPVKTNIDAMTGRTGLVTAPINNLNNTGRVQLDGDEWKARSLNNEIIPKGTPVKIIKTESILLIVTPN
jgi:membrane protein implicated in regulation of membrane protease activity